MANVWFRCPICGAQMPGDPRFPPACPNSANHPRLPPGQLPQQVVYLPPRPPTWRERYREYSRRRRIQGLKILGVMFVIGLVCLVLGIGLRAVFLVIDPPRPGAPIPITAATFGGTIEAFQAKYGNPQPAGSGTAARQWKVTINGIHVLLSVTSDAQDDGDGENHIITMTIGPDGDTWTQATADQVLPTFLPGDATYQQEQNVAGVGPARLYQSADLGETFPASDFVDAQGNQVTPGAFWASFNTSVKGAYVLKLGA